MGRTMAVVLFTDLVGSTELRGRLGEEAADELRRKHDQLLTEAVEANNGRVVKGLGDGIMATFAGAADAVAAAVTIQQAIDRLNRSGKAPVPLAVRVGLSAGDVTFEDDDVHGTPVIEASRLCAAALGGEVLVADVVRVLAGLDHNHLVDRGLLELKGLAKRVPGWEVPWEPGVVCTIPMPALLTDVGPIFVSRDAELGRLEQLWKEAATGKRLIALLAGEPGVGKTRLAAELAVHVHEEGGVVLAGRCDEDMGVPYQPFVEALRHFVDHVPPSELPPRLGRYGGELVRLVPELTDHQPNLAPPLSSDPETERYRLFDAVAGWLAAAAVDQPVLFVLDDLQWAAKPTLLLLRHVVRSSEGGGLFVVGTYRDSELAYDHPLVEVLADLRRLEGVERFSLSGFDAAGVAAFMEQAAGRLLGDDDLALARAIHDETEGNPFFVREVLRHLAETGAIERREGGWGKSLPVDELGIPEGVREVIGRRLARLSKETNRVLRLASVAGGDFELSVLGHARDMDEDDVLAALEEAAAARLVLELPGGGRYRFAHALVRDTLYDASSITRRLALHRRVAEAIERIHAATLDDHLSALAHHWARASVVAATTPKAVDYATRAGHRALAQLAHDEAVAYYQQALELLDSGQQAGDSRQRLDLLLALGVAQRRAGDPAHRNTLLQVAKLAKEAGDADRLAEAALANTRIIYSYTLGLDAERIEMLEAAVDALPGGESATRARLLARLGQEVVFAQSGDRHHRLTADGLAMARRLGDRAALADALASRVAAIFADPGFVDEWIADTGELLALADHLGDPSLRAHAACMRFGAAFQAGMFDEAERALAEQEQAVAEAGQPMNRWFLLLCRTARLVVDGHIAEAETSLNETLEIGLATGQPDARQFHASTRFEILFETGRLDQDLDRLVQALDASGRPILRAMLALTYSELGRDDDAHQLLEALVAELPELPRSGGPWFRTVVPAALACARLGDRQLADPLFELLAPCAQLITGTLVAWSASGAHHLGMLAITLGRLDEADVFFTAAEVTHAAIPAPTWLARTRLEWARMLLARRRPGDVDRARHLLGQALHTARELGLANVERRAVALLQECP
jgi:class 3 adenylate cyclase/tetratricopeptide (TPR) repeat protein